MVKSDPLTAESWLPALREDLRLLPGPRATDGAPTWTLHDIAANRFFRLGWREFSLLSQWRQRQVAKILAACNQSQPSAVVLEDVASILEFLQRSQLLRDESPAQSQRLREQQQRQRGRWWWRLLQNYLFFRVPLVQPDAFLDRTYPYLRFVFSWPFAWLMLGISGLGIFQVIQSLDSFLHTFSQLFSWSGAVLFILVLSVIKVAHELGHAYTCKHFGLRVPSMGVAFMLLWPVLYTDATQAWTLTQRRARAQIAAAGVVTELMLAGVACVCWAMLDDGVAKTLAFLVASSTWLLSLVVNLNPFMRFDGYYLLSDVCNTPNLQPRSFALGRWWLRRYLWGMRQAAPEVLPRAQCGWMILYAFLTWLYRLLLFFGIALLLYHFTFKLLGIALFCLEIIMLIGLPVWRELRSCWQQRQLVSWRRRVGLLVLGGLGVALLCIPWQQRVAAPALWQASAYQAVYAPLAAQIGQSHVAWGQSVTEGELLFELQSPDLAFQITRYQARYSALEQELARRSTSALTNETRQVLESQLQEVGRALQGARLQAEQLRVTAPFSGEVSYLAPGLVPGRWLNPQQLLLQLVDTRQHQIEAYVREKQLGRVQLGQVAYFYPENPSLPVLTAEVVAIDLMDSRQLATPYLASVYGGQVAVRQEADGRLTSEHARFRIRLQLQDSETMPPYVVRGQVQIETQSEALLWGWGRGLLQLLIAESGF